MKYDMTSLWTAYSTTALARPSTITTRASRIAMPGSTGTLTANGTRLESQRATVAWSEDARCVSASVWAWSSASADSTSSELMGVDR